MNKKDTLLLILGIIFITGAIGFVLATIFMPKKDTLAFNFPELPSVSTDGEKYYSKLTGLELSSANLITSPTFCVQVPNGTDGARPQAGLDQAGVIFEAIAEAGITRFAAIFQNASNTVIGPTRSLRIYYLNWDVPFDCSIIHAGGSDDALQAVKAYTHLNGSSTYMYRGTVAARRWNNYFTTSNYLEQYSTNSGKNTANITGFTRTTPIFNERYRLEQQAQNPLEITTATDQDTSALAAKVSHITLKFGNNANYNVVYDYDIATNTYKRSYASGVPHQIYACNSQDVNGKNPENVCTLTQLAPTVVVAMTVQEKKAADNYHEDITSIGSNEVHIFQNGEVIKGTWQKPSRESQITFYDNTGAEIFLAPGQTIVSAVPAYGAVEY